MLRNKAGAAPAGSTKPTSQWLASNIGIDISPSLLDSVWTSRILFFLQTFAAPLALWFKPLCVLIALIWLAYRASQVLNRPLDDLSALLGFDIPSNPLIDLASIKADGAIVHWTLPEKPKQKSQCKYEIYLNGTVIDSLSSHESAITITGLQPDSFYVVRVALIHNEFSSKSPAIRFRTKPATTGDFFFVAADGHETDNDALHELMPRVRPYRALKDITPASPTSAAMSREGSSGTGPRRASGRRPSPAAFGMENKHDPQPDDSEAPEGAETIQQLTERLDGIRREADEAERQAKEEDNEETKQKEDLVKERDELRAQAAEKEKYSKNLKRDVKNMESLNHTAQNERSRQERLLQQKKHERQKLKDDMAKWDREVQEMTTETERIHEAKAAHSDKTEHEKVALRDKLADENTKLQGLDNQVKEKTSEVKKLERTLKNNTSNGTEQPEPNLVQLLQSDAEEDRLWQARQHTNRQQYAHSLHRMESAKRFHDEQMRYLEALRERRQQEEMALYAASPQPPERLPRRGDSQRSRHAPSRHSISQSPRLSTFAPSQSPFANSINPTPPVFNSAPFLNIQNGMTISAPTDHVEMSDEDKERLTGGAMMSPGAGADLLPADLFSGDGDNRVSAEHVRPLPGLGSLPGLGGPPQPYQPGDSNIAPGPASPGSASSRSASVFASPHASQHNLHGFGGSESLIDADRRSIRSTRSTRAASGGTGSRFGGMFGIKQRNKIGLDDGPPLAKSSSMPRQDQFVPGLDSTTRKRNSSISGSGFGSGIDGALDGSTDRPTTSARSRLNIFNRERSGGWPSTFSLGRRPQSPRPDSTHSNELPRPSVDSTRWGIIDGWQPGENASGARGSPLAFGPGWNPPAPQQSRLYGSRHPSRRPSVQYTASGPPEDIMEDDDSDVLDPGEGQQFAPIGTKPPPGSKKAAGGAKLNPNAKDFNMKSFFKLGGKSKESGQSSAEREASTPVASSTPNLGAMDIDDSPPNSRKSRDAPSTTTAESSTLESGRNSAELVRTPSYSTSDAPAPSPSLAGSAKETFMQKITRKSSSGKFGLSTFRSSTQRDKSRLDPTSASNSSAATPVPAEDDEDEMSASASSLRESKESSRGSRSWSSAFKLGKKKGAEVERESLSGMSGDEEDEG